MSIYKVSQKNCTTLLQQSMYKSQKNTKQSTLEIRYFKFNIVSTIIERKKYICNI